ncbi:Gfo/Idh/MocA family protein [Arcticibacter tournemirensis]|uniref:Gfo/Idh/MocA family oxidoreductase n=1 Tax=Arcticibacter tournemirensis TaxID=699437 RepID=A0A4Q0MG97_9SPHI|nr:Gfo/Idh/MocA family oxidoreductase [Arcticibacter tournemirensis]RXF72581.1 Gfo/Idh/MocA family oxidoreductase [Arcticibacter tournemirensis]
MSKINWGIIGCGNVTEVKSGPAFNKVPNSSLVAVMRRDGAKAEDYAKRHGVPKWYNDARQLIQDPDINAIYVATPPASHEEYALAALEAGKPVYVEKPFTLSQESAIRMSGAAAKYNTRLTVAHYRRGLQLFKKIKELLQQRVIGDIRFVSLQMLQPPQSDMIAKTEENWRLNPDISGGGLFHDLAPHQLDLMIWFFGKVKRAEGFSLNQAGAYQADDLVSGELLFDNNILFRGIWCFTVPPEESRDICEIVGSEGKISFSVFGDHYVLHQNGKEERTVFALPQHIQQPMIEEVVQYFMGTGPNPCTAQDGVDVMKIIDTFTGRG